MSDYIFAQRKLIKQLRDDNTRRMRKVKALVNQIERSHMNFYPRIKKSGGVGVPKHAVSLF